MLSQKPSDSQPDTVAAAPTPFAATGAPSDLAGADPMQALNDLLASPEFQSLSTDFDASPFTSPAFADDAVFDPDVFLTSPMETPILDFDTSPALDSPSSDFLTTPVISDGIDDALTGPVVADAGYLDNMDLFGGLSAYPTYEVSPQPPKLPATTDLYTISPSTPALDTIDPVATVVPPKPKATVPTPVETAPTRRRSTATGTRKNLKPESLIPLEAPTQKRHYVTESATSRKAVPAVFAAKKRLHSAAFADEDGELETLSPTASEQEIIEFKRRQNTLAARKSRKRKLEHQQMLETRIETLEGDVDTWKARATMAVDLLKANGIAFTSWDD